MTTPSASDLNLYDGTPFDQTDWDGNWNQAISWLTSGNYDMTFQNITATTYTGLPTETFNLTAGEDLFIIKDIHCLKAYKKCFFHCNSWYKYCL